MIIYRSTIILIVLFTLSVSVQSGTNSRAKRILNGSPAAQGEHPYTAKLIIDNLLCSAVVVRPRWLMTTYHCIASKPLSSVRFSVWGADGTQAPFRKVVAAYRRSLAGVLFTHILRNHKLFQQPDDYVFLLTEDAIEHSSVAFPSFESVNDSQLALNNVNPELVGYGTASNNNFHYFFPNRPYKVNVHFETFRFSKNAAEWFIATDGHHAGLLGGDSGGPVVINNSDGSKEVIGINKSYASVPFSGYYDFIIRLSAHYDEAIATMGWDDTPILWKPLQEGRIPEGSHRPLDPDTSVYFCRDSGGNPGVLTKKQIIDETDLGSGANTTDTTGNNNDDSSVSYQWACCVLGDDGAMERTQGSYDIMTGSIYEFYHWSTPVLAAPEDYFPAAANITFIRDNREETLSLENEFFASELKPYCRVATVQGQGLGILFNSMCKLTDGSHANEYQVLVSYQMPEITTTTPIVLPSSDSVAPSATSQLMPTSSGLVTSTMPVTMVAFSGSPNPTSSSSPNPTSMPDGTEILTPSLITLSFSLILFELFGH